MYDFWEVILFGTGRFKGNPMLVHKEVHDKSPMSEAHFQHWLALFHDTVDALFEGANAEDIKYSSSNIAKSLMYRVLDRKSTRLNSSHVRISYAVFCLKK